MSNDTREPDATPAEGADENAHEAADTSTPADQADARAELKNVLEDLDGYGER